MWFWLRSSLLSSMTTESRVLVKTNNLHFECCFVKRTGFTAGSYLNHPDITLPAILIIFLLHTKNWFDFHQKQNKQPLDTIGQP